MAELTDLPLTVRTFLRVYPWRRIDPVPWTPPPRALAGARVALVASAGLTPPGVPPFDEDACRLRRRAGDEASRRGNRAHEGEVARRDLADDAVRLELAQAVEREGEVGVALETRAVERLAAVARAQRRDVDVASEHAERDVAAARAARPLRARLSAGSAARPADPARRPARRVRAARGRDRAPGVRTSRPGRVSDGRLRRWRQPCRSGAATLRAGPRDTSRGS